MLFETNDIITEKDHTETILLKCFQVPDEDPIPTLTILFTPEIRKLQSRSSKQYNGLGKMHFLIGKDGEQHGEAELIDKPQAYCRTILSEAYHDSTGIVERPTKAKILSLIEEQPVFARALAGEIMGFFQGKDVKLKEAKETERKNSNDS